MVIGIGIGTPFGNKAPFAFLPAEAPSGLTATTISDTQIDLAWTDNSTDEDGYSIERSTDGITYAEIDTVLTGVVAYSDTTCVAGTLYYYRCRAYRGTVYSDYSNVDSDYTIPLVPTGLTSQFIINTILGQVDWTDNTGGTAQYEVWSATNGATSVLLTTTIAGAITYNDTTCKQNASVVYKIRSVIGGQSSAFVTAGALTTPLCWKTNQAVLTTVTLNSFIVAVGKTVTINWGDGITEDLTGTSTNKTHDYTIAGVGQYNISLTGDVNSITTFKHYAQSKSYGSLTNWILPSGLTTLYLYTCSFTGANPNILGNTIMVDYEVYSNLLDGTFNDIQGCTALKYFYVNKNKLTGTPGNLTGLNELLTYACYDCFLSGNIPDIVSAPKLQNFWLYNDGLAWMNNFTGSSLTQVPLSIREIKVQGNNLGKTELAELLGAIADYFTANAPTNNLIFNISDMTGGWGSMAFVVGDEANTDVIALKAAFTAAGKTLTFTYNSELNRFNKGKIIFSSDDGYATNYTRLRSLFLSRGKFMTHYVTSDYVGDVDFLTWVQMAQLDIDGFDMQGHGKTSTQFQLLTELQLRAELTDAAAAFVANGVTSPLHESYPGGGESPAVEAIVADYRTTARDVVNNTPTFTNRDKYLLPGQVCDNISATPANPVNSIEAYERYIDWAGNGNLAYIFFVHKISDDDTTPSTTNYIWVEHLLDYAIARGDVDIITISELSALMP